MADWNKQPYVQDFDQDRRGAQYWSEWERVVFIGACFIGIYLITLINVPIESLTWEKVGSDIAILIVTFLVVIAFLQIVHMLAVRRRRKRMYMSSQKISEQYWKTLSEEDPGYAERISDIDRDILVDRALEMKKKLDTKWRST